MEHIHNEILDSKQKDIYPFIRSFGPNFYLVGGTALALQYGHRQSIDFDLFSDASIDSHKIRNKIRNKYTIERIIVDNPEELTVIIQSVKCTFLHYPFIIPRTIQLDKEFFMPESLTIAAMKAFALGQRAKWKDYVDLYFIFQNFSLPEVIKRAHELYASEFDEKLFREQLAYHEDINYSESVLFMPGYETEKKIILDSLVATSLS